MPIFVVTAIRHEQDTPLFQKQNLLRILQSRGSVNYEQKLEVQAAQLQQTNLLLGQAKQMAAEKAKPNLWSLVLLALAGLILGAVATYLILVKK